MKLIRSVLALAVMAAFAGQAHADYAFYSISSNLRDMAGATNVVSGDDSSNAINLPFQFSFYGTTYSTAHVSTNGFLSFNNSSAACCHGAQMGSGNNGASINLAWTDWINNVQQKTFGAIGSREFVLQWSGNEYAHSNNLDLFQLVLHEQNGEIEFQYGTTFATAHKVSAGVQDGLANGSATSLYYGDGTGNMLSGKAFSTVAAVPEPETYAMFLAGLGIMGAVARRRKQA